MSLDIYTTHLMEDADIDSVTSEATGFPKENMNDFNPDTYWKLSSATTASIDIDLQSSVQVDAFGFWVRNYKTDFADTNRFLRVESSPNDSDYTERYLELWNAPLTHPIYVVDLDASQTDRYWRISLAAFGGSIVNASQVWMMRKYSISHAHQYPNNDRIIYHNRIARSSGGRQWAAGINKNPQTEMVRNYLFSGTANYTALSNAFNASRAQMFPVMLNEGGIWTGANFADNYKEPMEVAHQVNRPTVRFRSIPYIADGNTY